MPPVAFLQKPIRWLKAISTYRATSSGGPNFAYDLCVKKIQPEQLSDLDLSSWDLAFNGAEPICAETLEQFSKKFACCGFNYNAFYPCYGMAETTLLVTGGEKKQKPVILEVKPGNLEQNSVVESEISSKESREGPFLRTGDLGFLHDKELFVTGRIKDVIIIRGRNHYPQDIELTVQKSHPALRPDFGAAFSVKVKGEEQLVIVQEVERTYLRKLDAQKVIGNIIQAVTTQHGLEVYAAVLVKTNSIPKTSSGKIQRYACRISFLNGNLNVVEDWVEAPWHKAKFRHLQTDVESLLQELKTCK